MPGHNLIGVHNNFIHYNFIFDLTGFPPFVRHHDQVFMQFFTGGRLFVPIQVAREFLANRTDNLIKAQTTLTNWYVKEYDELKHVTLLEQAEYDSFNRIRDNLKEAIKAFRKELKSLIEKIPQIGWNDPVFIMYKRVFEGIILSDSEIDYNKIEPDLKRRNENKIPPGYKDKEKGVNAEGDLIIWHEILSLGRKYEKDLIFVSGDVKIDWCHSIGTSTITRAELIDEYRIVSGGKTFQLITLSRLLELFELPSETVKEIQQFEDINRKSLRASRRNLTFTYNGREFNSEGIGWCASYR